MDNLTDKMRWKTLKTKTILSNSFFSVQQDQCKKPDGAIIDEYYIVKRPDVAVIAAFTEKMELILIRQYRHPVNSTDFELPAGHIDAKENHILEAAERELLEETGYKAEELVQISKHFASSGLMNNTVHFFIGFNAKKIQEQTLDPNEAIEVKITPWKEALKLLEEGKIKDLGSATGVLWAKEYLGDKRCA